MNQCLFCGHTVKMIHVHGHYQCPVCNTNALPCCDGDNCETNYFFQNQEKNYKTTREETRFDKKEENQ